jgi:hypothetical protein
MHAEPRTTHDEFLEFCCLAERVLLTFWRRWEICVTVSRGVAYRYSPPFFFSSHRPLQRTYNSLRISGDHFSVSSFFPEFHLYSNLLVLLLNVADHSTISQKGSLDQSISSKSRPKDRNKHGKCLVMLFLYASWTIQLVLWSLASQVEIIMSRLCFQSSILAVPPNIG